MTVYELIQRLAKFEADEEVLMIDGGEDVPVLSIGDTDNRPVLFPWPYDQGGDFRP